jgi:putative heme transporter
VELSTSIKAPGAGLRALVGGIAPDDGRAARRRSWSVPVLALVGAGLLALLIVPHAGQFVHAVHRALRANWRLVLVGAALEAGSVGSYVLLLHRVVARADPGLRLKDSCDVTLGGAAATRLVPAAGLGGVAVTMWALRARGVPVRELTERLLAFLVLLYAVYVSALLGAGAVVALAPVGVTHGRALGALGAAIALAVGVAVAMLLTSPLPVARALNRAQRGPGRLATASRWMAAQLPALGGSLRRAWHELRRPNPALLGAAAYWACDLGVLAVMLHAFGVRLPLAAVVLAYFLGTLFNLLPIPGSLSGGLAGCLIALGSPAGAAIAAVLAYRAIAVWLPAVPGLAALARLRTSVASWKRVTAGRTLVPQFPVRQRRRIDATVLARLTSTQGEQCVS